MSETHDSPVPDSGDEGTPVPAPAPVHLDNAVGLKSYVEGAWRRLDNLPRVPKPSAADPEIFHEQWFTLLSWQDPIATGGLAAVVFSALWAVGMAELTWAQVVLFTAVGAVALGGLLSLANAFTSEGQRLSRFRFHDETVVANATAAVSTTLSAVLHRVQEAVDWTHASASAITLGGLWTAARWAPWLTTGTITVTALLAFTLPAVAVLYRPQITALWNEKAAPALAPATAAVSGVVGKLKAALAAGGSSKQLVMAGLALVGLLVLYGVVVYFELINLLDVAAWVLLAAGLVLDDKSKRA